MEIISEREKNESQLLKLELSDGWIYVNNEFHEYEQRSSDEQNTFESGVNAFFNGNRPNLPYIFAELIPRRKIVTELLNEIDKYQNKKLHVIKLTAPGGEGKSTILRQLAADLARRNNSQIQVIFRWLEGAQLTRDLFEYLLNYKDRNNKASFTFFMVADDAETIASDVSSYVNWLEDFAYRPSNKIRFLLAAKGTEWQWKKTASSINWSHIGADSDFHEVPVNRLERVDALVIAKAWKAADISGKFDKETAEQLADRLFYVAKFSHERDKNPNSFYSAIFEVRQDKNLERFIAEMLERFEAQPALEGKNLKECYEYIVALHGDGKHILTKPVLQRVLGCSDVQLDKQVIEPLADEKVKEGNLILARHDVFAQHVKHILERKKPNLLNKIVPELAVAAEGCFRAIPKEVSKPENSAWLRMIREYFDNKQTQDLAIDIAQALAENFPANPVLVVRYAEFLRKAGEFVEAHNVLLDYFDGVNLDKGYFAEWGVVQGKLRNYSFDALLTAVALSDNYKESEDKAKPWLMRLASLATAFSEAYNKSIKIGDEQGANIFKKATQGTVRLGDEKNAEKTGNVFRDYGGSDKDFDFEKTYPKLSTAVKKINSSDAEIKRINLADSFQFILDGVKLAWEICEINKKNLPQKFPQQLEYSELLTAFGIRIQNQAQTIISLSRENFLSQTTSEPDDIKNNITNNLEAQFIFRQVNGGFWEIAFGGKAEKYKNYTGFRYIHKLLLQPNEFLSLKQLYDEVVNRASANSHVWRTSCSNALSRINDKKEIPLDMKYFLNENVTRYISYGTDDKSIPCVIYKPEKEIDWKLF